MAQKALGDASTRSIAERVIKRDPLPVVTAPGYDEMMADLGHAATAFVEAAKEELGLPDDTT